MCQISVGTNEKTIHISSATQSTVRQRTANTKNCGNRTTTLTMDFKLIETAQKKWFLLRGYNLFADVFNGVKFVNGIKQIADQKQNAA
jgi:putative transposase